MTIKMKPIEALKKEFSCHYLADELPYPFAGETLKGWATDSAARLMYTYKDILPELQTILIESENNRNSELVKVIANESDYFGDVLNEPDDWLLLRKILKIITEKICTLETS